LSSGGAAPASAAAKKKGEQHAPHAGVGGARDGLNAPPPIGLTGETAAAVWQQTLGRLSGLLAQNASLCESVNLADSGRLVATFRAKYTSCRAFCERPDQLASLERAAGEVVGAPVQFEFAIVPDEVSATAARHTVPHRQRMAEKAEHPMIRRATELFDARLVRIEEPPT
jgi:hypothetical protein